MKRILSTWIFLILGFFAFSQVAVNPDDDFYINARNWELKGYIKPLPQVRPYPVNLVKEILETVIDCGNRIDASLALDEYERFFGTKNKFYVDAGYGKKITKNTDLNEKDDYVPESDDANGITFEFGLAGDHSFNGDASIAYDFGMFFESEKFEEYSPYKINKPVDAIFDPSEIGPLNLYLDWNFNLAYGKPDTYIFGGISRMGFGPFVDDGIALNDTAYHCANIVFNVSREKWSFVQVFESLGATNNLGESNVLNDGKFLAFHSIRYHFNKYIDITYYENVIFGPRFNWAFILPAPYMPVQNIGGAPNNLQMGLMLEVKPVDGVKWATDIFVDDISVNDIVKFNFDTKIRLAGQSGIIFAPSNTICRDLSLYYTFVLPYVYAHWEYNDGTDNIISGTQYNYQNYLNAGRPIGSNLSPNSDRVSFKTTFNSSNYVKMSILSSFARHCNSAESFDDEDAGRYMISNTGTYITDGTANMHQMFMDESDNRGSHVNQSWDCMGFMTGEHKMTVASMGLEAEIRSPKTKRGQFFLTLGYTFEYVHNKGVDNNMYPGNKDTGLSYEYNNGEYIMYKDGTTELGRFESLREMGKAPEIQEFAKAAKDEWLKKLHDEVNQYIKVSIKWVY